MVYAHELAADTLKYIDKVGPMTYHLQISVLLISLRIVIRLGRIK